MLLPFHPGNLLYDLGELYVLVLIVRALLGWFPYDPTSPLNGVRSFVFTITEPVLAPFRRLIPPVGGLDVSFIVAVFVVQIVVAQILGRIPL